MTLIEKIEKFRKDNSVIANNTSIQNILNQLLDIYSKNENTLPKSFELNNIDLLGLDIEDVLENLGFNAHVDMFSTNWDIGAYNYKVFILSEK